MGAGSNKTVVDRVTSSFERSALVRRSLLYSYGAFLVSWDLKERYLHM